MPKLRHLAFLSVVLVLVSLSANIAPSTAQAKDTIERSGTVKVLDQSIPADKAGKVVVVRDVTAQANCYQIVDGSKVSCATGSVFQNFFVTEEEAKAKGEDYFKYAGDPVQAKIEIDKLFSQAGAKARAKSSSGILSSGLLFHSMRPAATCGNKDAKGYFTAIGATVYVDFNYDDVGSGCTTVAGNTIYNSQVSGTTVTFDRAEIPLSSNGHYDPGCPIYMGSTLNVSGFGGGVGMTFENHIEDSCNWFANRGYGSIVLT